MGCGWGLRMSSPRRILRTSDAANRGGLPAVLTIHPWELDPHPPRVKLPARLHFAHYFRLRGFSRRLREVLRHASFGPIGDMMPVSGSDATRAGTRGRLS
jgi:peptidoglycan-N-acetylglucosamine deacetylase